MDKEMQKYLEKAEVLIEALPYIQKFNKRVIVVKYGGSAMIDDVLKEDVKEVVDSNNTELKNTKGVPVLNYHFVYKPEEETCNQEICHPESQFRTHLSFIKDNGYFNYSTGIIFILSIFAPV